MKDMNEKNIKLEEEFKKKRTNGYKRQKRFLKLNIQEEMDS